MVSRGTVTRLGVNKLTKVNKFNCWSKVHMHISQRAALVAILPDNCHLSSL